MRRVDPSEESEDVPATQALAAGLDFDSWRDRLPSLEVDGELLYLPAGDMLMDQQQLTEYWERAVQATGHKGQPPG